MKHIVVLVLSSLLLQGCFPTVFAGATGATVSVAKDRSLGETVDDVKIATKIKADMMRSNFRSLYTKLSVEVLEGRVMYTGVVDSEEDIMNAVEIAWKQEGVKEVLNEIEIDSNSNHFDTIQYTKDSIITAQVKAKTIIAKNIKFVNYTIITSKNIVYIFGIARSQDEMEQVANIAAQVKGVEKVVSHVNIKDIPVTIKEGE